VCSSDLVVRVAVCLLALVSLVAAQLKSAAEYVDEEMAILPTQPDLRVEDVPDELVNGGYAVDTTLQSLDKGPKVNGGFALNPPLKKATTPPRVSNADCAGGHIVDGKCLRQFPKPARKASPEDNMESPEQQSRAAYEPDIHQFVRKHFGQDVMEETPVQTHNVGLPGPEIINFEMNKNSNLQADGVADSLFPIGVGMMTEGDAEVDVNIIDNMNGSPAQVGVSAAGGSTVPTHSSHPVPGATITRPVPGATVAHSTPITSGSTTASTPTTITTSDGTVVSVTTNDGPAVSATPDVIIGGVIAPAPVVLTDGQNEVAELKTTTPTVVVNEDGDLEGSIPQGDVDEEPGLPPTPTPTPTPNLELIAQQKAEAEKRAQEVAACMIVLEGEGLHCTSATEGEAMSSALIQSSVASTPAPQNTTAPVCDSRVKLVKEPFNSANTRENLHSLVLFCTESTTRDMVQSNDFAQHSLLRVRFTQKLIKYATILSCIDSKDFPGCVPEEALRVVQSEPVQAIWTCF